MRGWRTGTDASLDQQHGYCTVRGMEEDVGSKMETALTWSRTAGRVRCLLTGLQITSPVFNFQYQCCQRTTTNNNNNNNKQTNTKSS